MSISITLGEVREIRIDGTPLRYREAGDGPPLLFLHGLLVNGDLWRQVVPQLSARFRCITPDLPLGSHELPVGPGSPACSPRGVANLVAGLIRELGLEGVTVVANDTGGAIAQLLVTEHPGVVARLVLTPCDCFEHFFPPMFKPLQVAGRSTAFWRVAGLLMRSSALLHSPMGFGLLTRTRLPREIADSYLGPVRRSAAVRRDVAAFLRRVDKRDTAAAGARLGEFRGPVLIAWADYDGAFPREYARRLAAAFGATATLRFVEDSRSFVPEDQPARLAELITEFAGVREGEPAGVD